MRRIDIKGMRNYNFFMIFRLFFVVLTLFVLCSASAYAEKSLHETLQDVVGEEIIVTPEPTEQKGPGEAVPPLLPWDFLNAPLSSWDEIMKTPAEPGDLDNFEYYMRKRPDDIADTLVFKAQSELPHMKKQATRGMAYTPSDPGYNDPLHKEFFDVVFEMVRDNPAFGESDLVALGESLKQIYREESDKVIEHYRQRAAARVEQ